MANTVFKQAPKQYTATEGSFEIHAHERPDGKVDVMMVGPGRLQMHLVFDNFALAKPRVDIAIEELQTAFDNYQSRVAAL